MKSRKPPSKGSYAYFRPVSFRNCHARTEHSRHSSEVYFQGGIQGATRAEQRYHPSDQQEGDEVAVQSEGSGSEEFQGYALVCTRPHIVDGCFLYRKKPEKISGYSNCAPQLPHWVLSESIDSLLCGKFEHDL